MTRSLIILTLCIAGGCAGCDSRSAQAPAAPPRPPTVWGTATIKGKVTFVGTPPVMPQIQNKSRHDGVAPIAQESVVIGENGGLANTFVCVEGIAPSDGSTLPPATMDQKDCRFVPHAVGVAVGQKMVFHSSDQTLHNVTYTPSHNAAKNFAMAQAGAQATTSFTAAEFIPVRCDVHPWMTAQVGVFENPFFAVTGPDGSFEIKRVPAGEYKLAAWHEQYGPMEQTISVNADGVVNAAFEYKAP